MSIQENGGGGGGGVFKTPHLEPPRRVSLHTIFKNHMVNILENTGTTLKEGVEGGGLNPYFYGTTAHRGGGGGR